jgi:hypothetical protein
LEKTGMVIGNEIVYQFVITEENLPSDHPKIKAGG